MPDRGANSANPRFVVTSLKADAWKTQPLYERLYCARGSPPRSADRVSFGERVAALLLRDGKPHQGVPARSLRRPQGPHAACCVGWLHQRQDNARQSMARRPSIRSLKGTRPAGRGGQLRLWLALMAYVLLTALRRIGLAHTDLAKATCGTIGSGCSRSALSSPKVSAASRLPSPRPAPTLPSSASPTPDYPADRATGAAAAPPSNNAEPSPVQTSANGATARHACSPDGCDYRSASGKNHRHAESW
jgi:hypothetical protein